MAALVGLGLVAGPPVAVLTWVVGTLGWVLLLALWPSGPIREAAVQRGFARTFLLAPTAFPFGIGMAVWTAIELLGALGI